MTILESGNVGIGIDSPVDAKLAVQGTIASTEVVVRINPGQGPDFVFNSNYDLRSLDETEEYINQHNPLPDIPSAREMEENGVGLAEINMKLLQKIEEPTLHLIEQNKELKTANHKIEQLQLRLSHLEKE